MLPLFTEFSITHPAKTDCHYRCSSIQMSQPKFQSFKYLIIYLPIDPKMYSRMSRRSSFFNTLCMVRVPFEDSAEATLWLPASGIRIKATFGGARAKQHSNIPAYVRYLLIWNEIRNICIYITNDIKEYG